MYLEKSQVQLGLVKSGQVKLGQVKTGQVKLGEANSGQVKSGQLKSSQVKSELKKVGSTGSMLLEHPRLFSGTHDTSQRLAKLWSRD